MAPASMKVVLVVLCALVSATAAVQATNKPPAEWVAAIRAGDLLFSPTNPEPGYFPYVGNGYVATELFTPTTFLGGVFNGISNNTPSHRAAIPSPVFVDLPNSVMAGAALDIKHGAVYNRSRVLTKACSNVTLQQTWYAHRAFRDLLVYQIEALDVSSTCVVATEQRFDNDTPDFHVADRPSVPGCGNACLWSGNTLLPEIPVIRTRDVALAFQAVPSSLTFAPGRAKYTFLSVARSDLDSPEGPIPTAMKALSTYSAMDTADLWSSHTQAWADVWSSGIDLKGNVTIAASVNSSLYYILSSARSDWPYGLSPGGLSTDDYHGHSFWDTETWMYPNLLLLSPTLARSLLQYRANRLHEARLRGVDYGYAGAMWPWESAFTGADCVPDDYPEGRYEQHITGDIVVAFRQFWHATLNETWLRDIAWDVVSDSCEFFTCRATLAPVYHPGQPSGGCGIKGPTGNYTMLMVQPPDESAGVVNSSAYTNGVMSAALNFCLEAASELDMTPPSEWADIASRVYLPVVTDLYPDGPVHPEYATYHGQTINQADVALLQYPLGFSMPRDIAENDLKYYTSVTDPNGYFTGDSSYSIAWLALGQRTQADALLQDAFLHMDIGHFNVWKERAFTGGNLNFLTGAGGYLQNFMFGYSQLRLESAGRLTMILPPVLPPTVTEVTLRSISLVGHRFSLSYNSTDTCFTTVGAAGLQVTCDGGVVCVPEMGPRPTCIPNQALEISKAS